MHRSIGTWPQKPAQALKPCLLRLQGRQCPCTVTTHLKMAVLIRQVRPHASQIRLALDDAVCQASMLTSMSSQYSTQPAADDTDIDCLARRRCHHPVLPTCPPNSLMGSLLHFSELSLLRKGHTYEEICRGCHQPAKLNLDERDEYARALAITWANLLMYHRVARGMFEYSRTVLPAYFTHRMCNECIEVLLAMCSP